jgi:hypothetical protein
MRIPASRNELAENGLSFWQSIVMVAMSMNRLRGWTTFASRRSAWAGVVNQTNGASLHDVGVQAGYAAIALLVAEAGAGDDHQRVLMFMRSGLLDVTAGKARHRTMVKTGPSRRMRWSFAVSRWVFSHASWWCSIR